MTSLIENLIAFNLTRQEAAIYVEFLVHGEMSGYEVAKETGFSRSNVYASLQSLAEKGALFLIQGESTKYTPVPIKDFLSNAVIDSDNYLANELSDLVKKLNSTNRKVLIEMAQILQKKQKKR